MTKLQKVAINTAMEHIDAIDFSLSGVDPFRLVKEEDRGAFVEKIIKIDKHNREAKRKAQLMLMALSEEKDS